MKTRGERGCDVHKVGLGGFRGQELALSEFSEIYDGSQVCVRDWGGKLEEFSPGKVRFARIYCRYIDRWTSTPGTGPCTAFLETSSTKGIPSKIVP
jgi:hypothetical protein